MGKNNWLVVGIVALIVVGAGLVWVLVTSTANKEQAATSPGSSAPANNNTQTSDTSAAATTAVDIKNFAFSPAKITVKKGTKVTWTNQDTVGHNVEASDAGNSGGLPTEAELLGKGQTFSFTFNQTGTFSYHCSPHPYMKGTVEVTE